MKLIWPYIAGFFDGEGSVTLGCRSMSTKYPAMNLSITLSQAGDEGRCLLSEIREFLRENSIKSYLREQTGLNSLRVKRMWNLAIMGRPSVVTFLTLVFPWLHIKKVKSQDVLRYLKLNPPLPSYYCKSRNSEIWANMRNRKEMIADFNAGLSVMQVSRKYQMNYGTVKSRAKTMLKHGEVDHIFSEHPWLSNRVKNLKIDAVPCS